MLDQLRNLKYNFKKIISKIRYKILLNFNISEIEFRNLYRSFRTQEFQTWEALNLTNPTKNTSNYSKTKEDEKKEKQSIHF